MLVRSYNGNMIMIRRDDYVTNTDYYNKIIAVKFNKHIHGKKNQVENIISTILYG